MARVLPAPVAPMEAERNGHEVTHAPAKPSCDWCVLGKAAQGSHRIILKPEVKVGAPVVQMDYAFLSTKGELTK